MSVPSAIPVQQSRPEDKIKSLQPKEIAAVPGSKLHHKEVRPGNKNKSTSHSYVLAR